MVCRQAYEPPAFSKSAKSSSEGSSNAGTQERTNSKSRPDRQAYQDRRSANSQQSICTNFSHIHRRAMFHSQRIVFAASQKIHATTGPSTTQPFRSERPACSEMRIVVSLLLWHSAAIIWHNGRFILVDLKLRNYPGESVPIWILAKGENLETD